MKWACRSGVILRAWALAPLAATAIAFSSPATAGDVESRVAPVQTEHALNLEFDAKSHRSRRANDPDATLVVGNTSGLTPLTWPRSSDIRARLLATDLQRTPVIGWMAASLYRSRKEPGWCVEVDPGGNQYLIQYRLVLR